MKAPAGIPCVRKLRGGATEGVAHNVCHRTPPLLRGEAPVNSRAARLSNPLDTFRPAPNLTTLHAKLRTTAMTTPFVTPAWLAEHLNDPDVVVVDGSWYLPALARDPRAEYLAGHIPGAIWFDVDQYADLSSPLPHMLLPPADFAALAGRLGIADTDTIVVYDGAGLSSAPRVRWTFTVMGAKDVRILSGGLPAWRAENRPLETAEVARPATTFHADFDPQRVALLADMQALVRTGDRQIIDARPAGRFAGTDAEPRPGLKPGHMPNAISAPATTLVESGRLKSPDALKAQFVAAGIDLTKPIVTTCGSGVTAATLKLALEQAGAKDVILYDGSWAEWGGRDDTEVVRG
jgi:thiosulfate/3-mercaptopyruvate sulfurtransferase